MGPTHLVNLATRFRQRKKEVTLLFKSDGRLDPMWLFMGIANTATWGTNKLLLALWGF